MKMMPDRELDEPVLPNNYPVFGDFWYVVDGEPKRSPVFGVVANLKAEWDTTEIRRCDAVGRGLPLF